jgi:hypothetical protein
MRGRDFTILTLVIFILLEPSWGIACGVAAAGRAAAAAAVCKKDLRFIDVKQ